MTQYNTLNVKLSDSQLNKLKSGIKNETEVTLNFSSNLIENSNDETNVPQKLLLSDTQVSKIRKAFANGSSATIKFSRTQLSKIVQSGEIPGELLAALPYAAIKAGTQKLIKTAPELTRDAARYLVNKGINRFKKDFMLSERLGITLRNNEVKYIIKVFNSLDNRGISIKETTTKVTSQEGGFLNFVRPLMTAGFPLMKSVLTLLAKSVLIP